MRLLLDTHVLLWWLENRPLSNEVDRVLRAPESEVYVSVVTAWELAIKGSIGKLRVMGDWEALVDKNRFVRLPLEFRHVQSWAALPSLHRDPFDRMLIAQALADSLTLATRDRFILQYPVATLLA